MVMMMINPPLNPPADAGQALPGGERKKPLRFLQNIGAVGCSNFNRGYSALMVIG